MPLRGIPRIISPQLLKILAEMGHGDELVLADANFPAQSCAEANPHNRTTRIVHQLGTDNVTLLAAILTLMPLDQYVEQPAAVMSRVPADVAASFPVVIYDEFQRTLDQANQGQTVKMEYLERFDFYERAKECFAVVQTGEKRQYGNIIIKKGVVRADEEC